MSKITIDREVLEQAIDALEQRYSDLIYDYAGKRHAWAFEESIAAMREALEQPQPVQAERCELCNYQHGHQIGCENNPVDIALNGAAQPKTVQRPKDIGVEQDERVFARIEAIKIHGVTP